MTTEPMKQIKSYSPLKWKGFDNQIELTHFVNRNGIADVVSIVYIDRTLVLFYR